MANDIDKFPHISGGPPEGWVWQEGDPVYGKPSTWQEWAKQQLASEDDETRERADRDYRTHLELAVLGAVLMEPDLLPETLAYVGPGAFQNSCCRNIYDAMLKVEVLSLHSLLSYLKEQNRIEACGGPGFIGLTIEGAPVTLAAAKRLSKLARREEHARNLRNAAEQAASGLPVDAALLEVPDEEPLEELQSIDLSSDVTIEATDWTIKEWVSPNDNIVIAGEPGVGKSFVALDLAIALATGTSWIDLKVSERKRVIYCDEENSANVIRSRVGMLTSEENYRPALNPKDLLILHNNAISYASPSKWSMLLAKIAGFKPDWVVFDSLVRFHNQNENDNSAMSAFFNQAIKPLPCGVVMLHHLNKPSLNFPGGINRMRGASTIGGDYGSVWMLERVSNGLVSLKQIKNRHIPEVEMKIRFTNNQRQGLRLTRG